MKTSLKVTLDPIDPMKELASVGDPTAGGTVVFIGTVRARSNGRHVVGLEYEAYKEMAEKRMDAIAAEVGKKWPVIRLTMVHRVGRLRVGEASVVVAASAAHRAEAFDACRYGIDTIKNTLPLWKKEKFRGGSEGWVEGTPMAKARA